MEYVNINNPVFDSFSRRVIWIILSKVLVAFQKIQVLNIKIFQDLVLNIFPITYCLNLLLCKIIVFNNLFSRLNKGLEI